MEAEKKDRIIVIAVDRDNDLGQKAEVEGPVIGKEKVIEAASKLGTKDPTDSDVNAMFEAVRVYDEVRRQYDSEVAILTGDRDVGIKSDRKIKEHLDQALSKFRANLAVLISDGSEDEHVMPIIQSTIPILSVRRLVVKQSEQLESTYYKVKDFMKESLEDPKMARLVFGLPAVALLLIAIFGMEGWRAVMGILGAYLVVKGFRLEGYFTGAADELQDSFTRKRMSFFLYMIGIIFATLASYRGYTAMLEWMVLGLFETIAAFLSASVYYFWAAGTLAWLGKSIGTKKRKLSRAVSIPLFGFAITIVINSGVNMILQPDTSIYSFITSIVAGFVLLFIAVYIEKK
jgi:putative membrane protein